MVLNMNKLDVYHLNMLRFNTEEGGLLCQLLHTLYHC